MAFMMLSSLCCGEIDSHIFIPLCAATFNPSFQALHDILSSIAKDPTSVNTFLEIDYAIESWIIIIDYLMHLNLEESD